MDNSLDSVLDTCWCPVCDRQILPKRYLVPAAQHPPATPAPPPSSPSDSPKNNNSPDAPMPQQQRRPAPTRTRTGGLAHGTGRIKPNGAVKPIKKPSPAPSQSPDPPSAPVKHRTVIDQSPIPLYCSDECRMKDINNITGALAYDYNPERSSPPMPPVPHNSFSGLVHEESDSSDAATSSSSLDSEVSPTSTQPAGTACLPKHIATLSKLYNFPPIPPAPPLLSPVSPTSVLSASPSNCDSYDSGIMMAARRITETLKPSKRSTSKSSRADLLQRERERKPIPGWTDGSDAWRADVYSFAKPKDHSTSSYRAEEDVERAYGGFAASPHRSRGVYSTLSDAGIPDLNASTQSLQGVARKTVDELYEKYPLSYSRRSESRMSLQYNPSSASLCSSTSAIEDSLLGSRSLPSAGVRRKEVKLVKPGAEGKLLVPDVKMVSRSPPSSYASSTTTASWYPSSSRRSVASIPSLRSPLSRRASELTMDDLQEESELEDNASELGWRSECTRFKGKEERERERKERLLVGGGSHITTGLACGSESGSLPAPKRPTVETRTWSYDNLLTYPAMPLPVKKVKRKERRVVDGEEREVEVEVDVCEPKRLFLFPGKEVVRA
ncbi:hypothetical protein NEOLEDRAFT_546782 [Neolentinus lepideus HHB14362 ss-1]|uniref:Uncharacterized protein n=1 Tax=Neolentinus lepideus HHB14362 ss-1 TaxID=1314782 RepID=A0A165R8M0_9AGAM|nr:hypothetical protein NEOLEDRAFT_546782 [Neolentinus lepideus HHB14362 ss-1]